MNKIIKLLALAALLLLPPSVQAKCYTCAHPSLEAKCYICSPPPAHGSRRSHKAIYAFKKQTGYLHGRPGWVIDHIVPLKRGGCDIPYNFQWMRKAEALAKDKWE